MSRRDFKLETTFTDKSNARWVALAAAAVLLIGIVLTMLTSIPEQLLPMNDRSLRALIPIMKDGSEPLALKALDQMIEGRKTLHVSGNVENRSETDIKELVAVIQPMDYRGKPLDPVEIPVEPKELLAFSAGMFEIVTELSDRPETLDIRFKMANGPYIPHKDQLPIVPQK